MQNRRVRIMKPQPSPKNGRIPFSNITNTNQNINKLKFQNNISSDIRANLVVPTISHRNSRQRQATFVNKYQVQHKSTIHNYTCQNHNDRNASFKLQMPLGMLYYCENCAYDLSFQGYKLLSIFQNEMQGKMLREVSQFLKACSSVLSAIDQKQQQLSKGKLNIKKYYDKLIKQTELERDALIRDIQSKYSKDLDFMQEQKSSILIKFRSEEGSIKRYRQEFEEINKDINSNIKNISLNFDLAEFQAIMGFYWNKVSDFENNFAKIHHAPLMNINLPLVFMNETNEKEPGFSYRSHCQNQFEKQKRLEREFTFSKRTRVQDAKIVESLSQNSHLDDTLNSSIVKKRYDFN